MAVSWMSVIALLLAFSSGTPIAVSPLPLDAGIVSIAPQECLWFGYWYGATQPQADSENRSEQLRADPQVQALMGHLWQQINTAIKREMNDEDEQQLYQLVLPLVEGVYHRPSAAFVSQVQPQDAGFGVQAAVVINTGDRKEAFRNSIEKLSKVYLNPILGPAQEIEIAGTKFKELPVPPPAPTVQWGFHKEYLIIAVGEGTAEKLISGINGQRGPPKWLTRLHEQLPVQRPAALSYINVQGALEAAAPFAGPEIRRMLDGAGLGNIQYVGAVNGLGEKDAISKSAVVTNGPPTGILKLVSQEPVTAEHLSHIPADSTWAAATRFDSAAAYRQVLEIIGNVNPEAEDRLHGDISEIEDELGFRILDELLEPLGDTITLHNAPSQGGLLLTGTLAVIEVRDREKLRPALERLIAIMQQELRDFELQQTEFNGRKIQYLLPPRDGMPLAPAWCLTDKALVIGLYPQVVKAHLARDGKQPSLAKVPEVAELLKQKPSTLTYQNTSELVRLGYPLLQAGAPAFVTELRREGVELDLAMLPSATAILPYLGPATVTVRGSKEGIFYESHETLPGSSQFSAAGPVLLGLLLPGVQSARTAARRSESMNNLQQIALAMHLYHETNRALPAPASRDQQGKPLLSWRVHVLPYIDQANLYNQFHLDEPWDSPHNKKLIDQMPRIYASPTDKPNQDKTRYLAPRGKETAFPDGQPGKRSGLGFANIQDGTSNTIMILEAAPDSAVVWTKPDDLTIDMEKPTAGLFAPGARGANAAFCDGSVRFLSEEIDKNLLKAYLTRSGGEVTP